MNNSIIVVENQINNDFIIPQSGSKDHIHRIRKFVGWLNSNGGIWISPNLNEYRDHLLFDKEMLETSVKSHLSSIRSHYKILLLNRDALFQLTDSRWDALNRKAYVDEIEIRIRNAIDPKVSFVRTETEQDISDGAHLRLTVSQVKELLSQIDTSKKSGKRDAAIVAVMACTGVRESEAANLKVEDLYKQFGGQPALQVSRGKNMKSRLIPYGDMSWCLSFVKQWLSVSGLDSGYVFRRVYKAEKNIGAHPISTRAIQSIIKKYMIQLPSGNTISVRPHDLRRTYARQMFEGGMKVEAIRQNMGHVNVQTTLLYIGELDVSERSPNFNLYGWKEDNNE